MAARTWTVEEVCAGVHAALEVVFPGEFWVRGEIHGLRRSAPGHLYFDLIEPGSISNGNNPVRVGVVAFRGALRGIEAVLRKVGDLELADGLEVRIRGKVDFYAPQGRVQFIMSAIDPRHTIGQLGADRDRIMRVLASEGLLERNSSVPIPLVPLRVGLVTSDDSAAYHDFLHELNGSPYAFEIVFADARVQGAQAEATLVDALESLRPEEVDVVAVVRGGGAKGDLLAFDRESVARAVATCDVPVIVGIGHEIDRSIVDEVANLSFKTPTACAAALVEMVAKFMQGLSDVASSTRHHATRIIHSRHDRLDANAARLLRSTKSSLALSSVTLDRHQAAMARSSMSAVERSSQRLHREAARALTASGLRTNQAGVDLERLTARLPVIAIRAISSAGHDLTAAQKLIEAIHPDRTLARGYSITRSASGVAVRSVTAIDADGEISTQLLDGEILSRVTSVTPIAHEDEL